MRGAEHSHDDPFCNLRAVDARAGGQGDGRVCVDRLVGNMICARADKVDQFEMGGRCMRVTGKGSECGEDCDILEELCENVISGLLAGSASMQESQ